MNDLKERIAQLEKENAELIKWQNSINQLLEKMLDMITEFKDDKKNTEFENELRNLWTYASINRYRINSLPYELQDPDYKSFYYKPQILSRKDTIKLIVEDHKSIARFGDGEFAAIVGQKRWNFQGESELLSMKLKSVLDSQEDNLLIGLNPSFYMNLFDIPESDADGVRAYMQPMVRKLHAQLLSPERIYANALFHNIDNDDDVENLRKIWNNRDCVFIEGIHTGMGVGNDLFDNCASIGRILGPAENAIDKYDEIMHEALKQPKNKLFLIALGPTATVLASELCKEGYQAIDIGHADLIYEGYIRRLPNLYGVDIPYKYCSVDEKIEGRKIDDILDAGYRSQIISVLA